MFKLPLEWLPRILGALGLVTLLSGVVVWLRHDAVTDKLREQAIQRLEQTIQHEDVKKALRKEIENASAEELRRRAAAGGMFTDPR